MFASRIGEYFDLRLTQPPSSLARRSPPAPSRRPGDSPSSTEMPAVIGSAYNMDGGEPSGDSGNPSQPRANGPAVLLHYLALVAGVASKFFLLALRDNERMDVTTVICSLIFSAVLFPFVYRRIFAERPGPLAFFISFQHGFFFQTLLEEVSRSLWL